MKNKILYLRVMITRKNIGISFCCIPIFILLSCSKSNHTTTPSPAPILNTFTYTLTDTTGIDHTYSDTARLNPDGTYDYLIDGKYVMVTPVAYIWQANPDSNIRHQFYFLSPGDDPPGSFNVLYFSLPYYQASLSGTTNDFLTTPFLLVWKGVYYHAVPPQPQSGVPQDVYLASFSYGTNISDSTNGYITGSFHLSATTIDSGKIQITGKFSNLTTTYKP